MTVTLSDALDGARLVETHDQRGQTLLWVWHGGHTVNLYRETVSPEPRGELKPLTSISVGDFGTGEVTVDDVRDGIESHHEQCKGVA